VNDHISTLGIASLLVAFRAAVVSLILVLVLAWVPSASAEVHVWFEPTLVDELDPVQLNIRVSDTHVADAPDLSVLESDFEILGSQTTSQRRSVNGKVESWVDYQFSLRPKRSGEITIPPIRVGDQSSAATQLIVRRLDPNTKQSIERMVFFETEVTVNPVYVQAQTIFIRRLYYANGVQLYSDLPGIPDVANAVIVPLGDTRSSTAVRDGTRYGVIEQRFALFPEQSGSLRIPESSITSSVRLRRDGRTRRSGIRISAPPQTLTVLPIPAHYPTSAAWLPATNVRLTETWSPNQSVLDLGDPITRSIAVTAVGNTGSSIPPLRVDFPSRHFKHYPESPTLDDDASGERVVGNRTQGYSLIPTTRGAASVPPVTLTWWDTQARLVRTAQLPGRMLTLRGSPTPDQIPAEPSPALEAAAPALTDTEPSDPAGVSGFGLLLALGLALAILASAGVLLNWRRRTYWPTRIAKPSRRRAMGALKTACASKDAAAMRQRLLQLIEIVYAAPQASALPQFLAQSDNAAAWQRLNATAYGPDSADNAEHLSQLVWRVARGLKAQHAKQHPDPLPPLYSN
jgi:hypothetical protein